MLKDSPIFPYIPAKDMERARAFYEGKVGLVPIEEFGGGVTYACGSGSTIFMYPTENAGSNKASCAFWDVADVEAEVKELKERGVVFETYDFPGFDPETQIANEGPTKGAWFKDTEGNIMAIIQRI